MHILYLDESGNPRNPQQRFFILAGVTAFERQTWWVESELERIAARFLPEEPERLELHGSSMFGGRQAWRSFPVPMRIAAMKDALAVIRPNMRVFAAVADKAAVSPRDPVEYTFEQVCSRFDYFLRRCFRKNDPQRGIIVFDKSSYENTLQGLTNSFRKTGHAWDVVRNLAEVPMFIDSKASRLVQLADLVSYAIYRKYEHGDIQFFDIIAPRFDSSGGVTHGFHERTGEP